MTAFWQQLIGMILAPTLVVGGVAWLLRTAIAQGFRRDIERFKAEVQRENDQHREKFLLIHNRRAEVIAELYSQLAKTNRLIGDLVAIFQQDPSALLDKKQRVAEAYNNAAEYFSGNRLFLPKKTAEKADKVLDTLRVALIEFDTAQMGNTEYSPDQTGLWIQSYKRVREEIPPILDELEDEFKEILGVEDEST